MVFLLGISARVFSRAFTVLQSAEKTDSRRMIVFRRQLCSERRRLPRTQQPPRKPSEVSEEAPRAQSMRQLQQKPTTFFFTYVQSSTARCTATNR
jgi:hypothetical protein